MADLSTVYAVRLGLVSGEAIYESRSGYGRTTYDAPKLWVRDGDAWLVARERRAGKWPDAVVVPLRLVEAAERQGVESHE